MMSWAEGMQANVLLQKGISGGSVTFGRSLLFPRDFGTGMSCYGASLFQDWIYPS